MARVLLFSSSFLALTMSSNEDDAIVVKTLLQFGGFTMVALVLLLGNEKRFRGTVIGSAFRALQAVSEVLVILLWRG